MITEAARVPKLYIDILDQVFEIEKKLASIEQTNSIARNINRLKELMAGINDDAGLSYEIPLGETFNETRNDVEASISGDSAEDLVITEVIKPIIRYRKGGIALIARKGVVIVQSAKP
ncbi:MAG: hypothetical protein IPN85_06280 [Flavobacteriales bacterium]|nr:hypothetical protein [Flavobacteriales bacterium]